MSLESGKNSTADAENFLDSLQVEERLTKAYSSGEVEEFLAFAITASVATVTKSKLSANYPD